MKQMTQVVLVEGTNGSNLNIDAGCRVRGVTVTNFMWEVFTVSCDKLCVLLCFWSQVAGDLEKLGCTMSSQCISHQLNILTSRFLRVNWINLSCTLFVDALNSYNWLSMEDAKHFNFEDFFVFFCLFFFIFYHGKFYLGFELLFSPH